VSDDDRFPTTRWSQLALAADRNTEAGQAALSELFELYRRPIHRHVRRRVGDPALAEDLTQTFFAEILARNDLAAVERSRGRLRTYLLRAVDNLIAVERTREATLRRGGHIHHVELTKVEAADESVDVEAEYDGQVALTLLGLAADRVGERYEKTGRKERFELLAPFIFTGVERGDEARLAKRLDIEPNSVAVALQRLRTSVASEARKILKGHVPFDQIDTELRHLVEALAATRG
jgi:RNA polymerase sigma-70 factor (ECF subfamily)